MQSLPKGNESYGHAGALPMAPRKMSFVHRPLFRSTGLGLHDLLRKGKRGWPSPKSNTSVGIGSSTLPWTAPKELKLLRQKEMSGLGWLITPRRISFDRGKVQGSMCQFLQKTYGNLPREICFLLTKQGVFSGILG